MPFEEIAKVAKAERLVKNVFFIINIIDTVYNFLKIPWSFPYNFFLLVHIYI